MRYLASVVLCLVGGFVFADEKLIDQVVTPYVEVRSDKGTGSGVVLLDKNGQMIVMTAKHVVDGSTVVKLYKRTDCDDSDRSWLADVEMVGEEADLAIVRPRVTDGLVAAKFDRSVKLERGEDCWYIGTHSLIHACLEKSTINRPQYRTESAYGGERSYTLINGNGWYGNSGGPMFVKRGDDYYVVGIVVQLAALNPRTPLCAERLEAMAEMLDQVK